MDDDVAITQREAFELLAFLLASAHGCLFDPPGYGVYRLASAAERLSDAWGPRAAGPLADYLRAMSEAIAAHPWDPMGRAEETEAFLNDLIAELAVIATAERGAGDG